MRRCRLILALTGAGAAAAVFANLPSTGAAQAQSVQRIAAIVNDEIISAYDLETRMRLVLFSTRLPDTADVRERLQGQVLRALIDEKLQMQEAKRRNIDVSRRDLQRAVENVEAQNGIPAGTLEDLLSRNDVPRSAMVAQMSAQIAWSKLVGRQLRPRISIGEDEIDEVMNRIKERQGQTEYRLSEIVLSVDSPEQEENIRGTAARLVDQIGRGANFSAIARQFSESPTAAVGGDLGWIHEAELDPALQKIVPQLSRGGVTDPIKTVSGYRILSLTDSRKIAQGQAEPEKVDLRQIFLPVRPTAAASEVESQIDLARTLRTAATGCEDFSTLAKEVGSPRSPELGNFEVLKLAPAIRNVVADLPEGQISEPVKFPDGVLLLMVCSRTGGAGAIKLPERDTIADQILQERLSLMARRYLRDIRLAAVVDIRV